MHTLFISYKIYTKYDIKGGNGMNEAMYIYLKIDKMDENELEEKITQMDKMLMNIGVKYSGIGNMYVSTNRRNRDNIIFEAYKELKKCEWLKEIFDHVSIGNEYYSGSLDKIDCSQMKPPLDYKIKYYEEYYKKTGKLPHKILIDENYQIIDGYISYLLARKYNIKYEIGYEPLVYFAESGVCHKKIVIGRHVVFNDEDIAVTGKRYYHWFYNKKTPVVPGDILLARTAKGKAYIVVDKIDYAMGSKECSLYKDVIRNTGKRIK